MPLGYVKWHVIGDLGNYRCYLGIGGGGQSVYNGENKIFWEAGWATEMITISYGIKNNGLTIMDTSYKVFLPKHDTVFVNIHF